MKAKKSSKTREERLLEQLRLHPELLDRFESILALSQESSDGPLRQADEIEQQLIQELRQLGNETLSSWATSAEQKVGNETKATGKQVKQREKKR